MKRIHAVLFSALLIGITSCGNNNSRYPQEQNHVTVSPMSNNVNISADKDNAAFDVNKLSEIVQKSTDPKVLEEKVNDPATNINNLDLDKDGKVDFLTVTEPGQNQIVISDASVNPAVTVATLTITPNQQAQTASMQIQGDPAYCGSYNTYYRPSISFGEILFLSYLLAPHPFYHPYYGYGRYPSYYSSRRTVVRTVYQPTRSQYVAPSRGGGGSSMGSRSSVSEPSRSQRSFGQRDASRPVGSGGFGNSASRSSSPAPSHYSAPSRPSSFGSGGGRRSFGGRRR